MPGWSGEAGAGDAIERLSALIARHAPEGVVPGADRLRRACGGDLRCAAGRIVEAWPGGARLEAAPEADPQLIRAGLVTPSVVSVRRTSRDALRIRLDRYARRARQQVLAALAELRPGNRLEIDLRTNHGGSIARMLEVAGLFTGPRAEALRIVGRDGTTVFDVPAPVRRPEVGRIEVLIGPGTRSSAEVFAALLHRYAGARLLGERTFGKDWAEQPFKVARGWYLMIRAGQVRIEGESLEGGLRPDAPLAAS